MVNIQKIKTMTKVIELRPDKNLIDRNFEKYQFSSDLVAVNLEKSLVKDVYRREPESSQDSWLEARLFAFHNHLFKNPYDSSSWFVDETRDVWRLDRDGGLERLRGLSAQEVVRPIYNPSVAFASAKMVVVTNGGERLEIFTENRSERLFEIARVEPGVILDARYIEEKSTVIVAMCRVEEVDGKKCSRLVFLHYAHDLEKVSKETSLELRREQILNVKGPIEYVYIEPSGKFFHTISQDAATFEYDSLKPVTKKNAENFDSEIKIPKYCWSQDEDSLTIWVKVPERLGDERARIDVTSSTIEISMRDEVLIKGESQHRLDPDLTTWKRDNDTVQLELGKFEAGLMWSELIKGDNGGECLPNEALAAEIHNRLSHLCTTEPVNRAGEDQPVVGFNAEQLEECDLLGRDNFLQRINLFDHTTTHLVMLGSSNHVLFTHKLKSGQALCLRHDHHGVVWIPEVEESEHWGIRHVGTFPGFGYVEASKTNKKFCVSPPNGSYVAIVEHTRHAFIYEKPEASEPVAKQRIVDLGPEASPIMGTVATNKHLILLTKNKIYELVIYR